MSETRRTPREDLRRRSRLRGAVAVEFALALPTVLLVLATGIHFGHAMLVRHRLAHATHHATRICAVRAGAPQACVQQQLRAALGQSINHCDPAMDVREDDVGGIDVVTVRATCQYRGGFAQMVEREVDDQGIFPLTVEAAFPRQ